MEALRIALLLAACIACRAAPAGVVINEVFYNAPGDLDDLQWIELHNTGVGRVDLGGFALAGGLSHAFPPGTAIEGGGYLVLARNPEKFRKAYGVSAIGPFEHPLKGSSRLELLGAEGKRVDLVRWKDREPWPVSADGSSASLERICPSSPGDVPENWAGSPLPADAPRPAGTPGKRNASFSAVLPPVIAGVTCAPPDPAPGDPLVIEAEVKGGAPREVTLLYRVVSQGVEGDEVPVPMERIGESGKSRATIPRQAANALVRYRVRAAGEAGAPRLFPAEHDLRPGLSVYVHDRWPPAKVSLGFIVHVGLPKRGGTEAEGGNRRRPGPGGFFGGFRPMGRGPREPRPPRGSSAFIHVDRRTGKTTVFDHINIPPRPGGRGYKVHFHKDRPLDGMTVASIIFEGNERFLLAESLAYDVYRRSGNAAPLSDFLRLWVDGRPSGYHLLVEQPNRSFLRRNEVRDDGDLYKINWFGRDVTGQHEKRSGPGAGHEDLLELIRKLGATEGDEQWEVIQENFNLRQVATYFAVNMVLSHWDGFFNNYFTYHDARGTKRWEMYPWDQDKTWGYHDGIREGQVFTDLPLTFGMEGDLPPGAGGGRSRERGFGPFGGGPFGGGAPWWRPGGYFSRPLLANPRFRKLFLARTREVLEKVYTPENYLPLLEDLAGRLKEDAVLRAEAEGRSPEDGAELLARNIRSLRAHLLERRRFLLAQEELRKLED